MSDIHFFAMVQNIKKIKRITDKRKIKIIEDCAQAHGSKVEK